MPIVRLGAPDDRQSHAALAQAAIGADEQMPALEHKPRLELSTLRRIDQMPSVTAPAISDTLPAADFLGMSMPIPAPPGRAPSR